MTPEEMNYYLSQGYEPLLVSYWKWIDVITDHNTSIYGQNCALCNQINKISCSGCPLNEINQNCNRNGAVWHKVMIATVYSKETYRVNYAIIMAMLLRALCKKNGIDTGD